jgi:NAD-dependent SIR2 family protein deacetylase
MESADKAEFLVTLKLRECNMTESKKYVLLQNNHSVAYTKKSVLVDEKIIEEITDEKHLIEVAATHKDKIYDTFLKKHYKHIVVLAAAGTSLNNGDKDGRTRGGLWTECQTEIGALARKIPDLENKNFYTNGDIEGLLSHVILYEKLNGVIRNDNDESLKGLLENKISKLCKLDLQEQAPHKDFLNKVTARKNNDARVQLFTTNYDTLFEQAAKNAGFVVIDGFSFTQPRTFAGHWFDLDIVNREKTRLKQEENFMSKVFHLYKLHGSLDWTKGKNEKNGKDEIIQRDSPDDPLIIYPASEKYESSYEQPYFEMMSRFQQALRKEETLLIIIGFGFQDKHIKNVIVEAVEQNPSFQLLIVNYNNSGSISTNNIEEFFSDTNKDNLKVKRNVNVIFDKFIDFTKKYPENQTYYQKDAENATI